MRIRLVRMLGQPPEVPLSADFDEQGGTIGRSSECTLVLPDRHKHVSRVQAEVTHFDGAWVLTDRGSANPVFRNGAEIGQGRQSLLCDGDVLLIGEYELAVELSARYDSLAQTVQPLPCDPAPLPPTQFWNSLLPAAQAGLPQPWPASGAVADAGTEADALKQPSGLAPELDPFAVAAGRTGATDGDPLGLGTLGGSSPSESPGRSIAPVQDVPESLDELFELGGPTDPRAADPLLGGPLGTAPAGAAHALSGDPLAMFGVRPTKQAAAPVPDDAPEIHAAFALPQQAAPMPQPQLPSLPQQSRPSTSGAVPDRPHAAGDPGASPAAGAYRSWENGEEPSTTLHVVVGPTGRPVQEAPGEAPSRWADSEDRPMPADRVQSLVQDTMAAHPDQVDPIPVTSLPTTALLDELSRRSAQAAIAARSAPADAKELLAELQRQFLLGAGLSELPRSLPSVEQQPAALTPELMRRIGELLRLSVQGTIDLLAARTTVKREMKSSVTVIAARDNNPLKFSPDAQAAIAHLLSPRTVRGFMEPTAAVCDAFDDLLAHQVGFMAGMRAALHGIIERLEPKRLDNQAGKSMLDIVRPLTRKARLWEAFCNVHAQLSRQAEDEFDALFGEAFVRAYDEQIDRIEQQRTEPR